MLSERRVFDSRLVSRPGICTGKPRALPNIIRPGPRDLFSPRTLFTVKSNLVSTVFTQLWVCSCAVRTLVGRSSQIHARLLLLIVQCFKMHFQLKRRAFCVYVVRTLWPPRPPWPGPPATPLCVATAPNTNSCMAQGPAP